MAQQGGPAASPNRRRLLMFGGLGLLAVGAAVIAGVLSSQKPSHHASSPSPAPVVQTASAPDSVHDALVKGNVVNVVTPVLPAGTAAPASSGASSSAGKAATGSDGIKAPVAIPLVDTFKAPAEPGADVCYPETAEELVDAVTYADCTFVVLMRSGFTQEDQYEIKKPMNVTTVKIVIGNPLVLTTIDAGKTRRAFEIFTGGYLDIRNVHLIRGGAQRTVDPNIRLVVGGTVVVHLGAVLVASGVIWREAEQTPESFLAEVREALTQRPRQIGGNILNIGGTVFLNGCTFYGARFYGSPVINQFAMGRDILTLAGNVIETGGYHVNYNVYGFSVVVGQVVCVLAGTHSWIGGGLANVIGMQVQGAAGSVVFVGGGVSVIIGITYGTATGMGFRCNYGQFAVGGGLLFQLGLITASTWGIGARFWVGANYAVGMGLMRFIGAASASATTSESGMGSGGGFFNGFGSFSNMGFVRISTRNTLYNAGNGFGAWNGFGNALNHHNPSVGIDICRAQYGIASDVAQGYGWINYINNTRYNWQVARFYAGLGNTMWMGYGGGLIWRLWLISIRLVSQAWVPESITVSGIRIERAPASFPFWYVILFGRVTRGNCATFVKNLKVGCRRRLDNLLGRRYLADGTVEDTVKPVTAIVADNYIDERTINVEALRDYIDSLSTESFLTSPRQQFENFKAFMNMPGTSVPAKPWGMIVNSTGDGVYACNSRPGPGDHNSGPGPVVYDESCGVGDIQSLLQRASDRVNGKVDRRLAVGAPAALTPNADVNSLSSILPDSHLLWYKVVVGCPTSKICLTDMELKTAIQDYLEVYTLEVAVSSMVPSAIAQKYGTAQLELALSVDSETPGECQYSEGFSVYIASSYSTDADTYAAKLGALEKDPKALNDILVEDGIKLCHLGVSKVLSHVYAPLDRQGKFDPKALGMRGPAIMLSASDSIAPIQAAVAGNKYTISIVNFYPGTAVEVQLLGGDMKKDDPPIASISSFPKGGVAEIEWTAPNVPGKYYFLAHPKGLTVPFGTSSVFTVNMEDKYPGRRW